jgi:hypothetical protein
MAVVRANYCKKGVSERKIAKANIYYIQTRPGRNKERLTRTLFGPSGTMGRAEANQFVTEAPKGTYFYRLRLSPDPKREDVKRDLNMHKLTRAMMKGLEKRLKTAIAWAGSLHDDHTDIRHVHILAAIPKHLQTYELEFLIREATANSLVQRRLLDRGVSRLPWQEDSPTQRLQMGKYTARRYPEKNQSQAKGVSLPQSVCSCPRCHMPHAHNGKRGSHSCTACGLMLHQKKERTLIRQRDKGRGLERSL